MDNMNKEYKKILSKIEEKLKDSSELEFVKSEINNLFMMFFNEIDELKNLYDEKIETILDRQSYFDEKLTYIEEMTKSLEKEIMEDEQDEYIRSMLKADEDLADEEEYEDCEIICPYCGELIIIGADEIRKEISCPYCTNLMELDWQENSDDKENQDDM